jgi:phosphomannomutase
MSGLPKQRPLYAHGVDEDVRLDAQQWLEEDPDSETRAELESLLDGDDEALAAYFRPPLRFGTAGIRGRLGPGPARMNRVTVRRLAAAVATRLAQEPGAFQHGVVVGHDARRRSADFAQDAASVLAGAGFTVHQFPAPVPTPLLAFAVRFLGAAAGVMITASHNPAADNGCKVYWRGGAQIAEPLDTDIAALMAQNEPVTAIPMSDLGVRPVEPDVRDAYVQWAVGLAAHSDARDLRIVYTPLHGVAADLLLEVLDRAGFVDVTVVPEQADPDPDFPTVTFPNPEEPGALDLALALARERDADLLIANDPDGDRIALAVPHGEGWRALTGDETGCLLAEELLDRGEVSGPAVATTVVSSTLLRDIAAHHGARYEETLTGFKWLARAADEVEAEGGRLVLAYEQALGVMCGDAVRDKDGISAAVVAADLAAARAAAGSDLSAALDELALRHGVHATAARSVRLDGAGAHALAAGSLDRLRSDPPRAVLDAPVEAFDDRKTRTRFLADGSTEQLGTPPAELIGVLLGDGSRLQVRPSGTEPLLKFYAEAVEPVTGGDVAAARDVASARAERLVDAFVERTLGDGV